MSNFILNEGYNKEKNLFFEKGYRDIIFSKKKKFIDLSFCSGENLLGNNIPINKNIDTNIPFQTQLS